MSTKTRPHSILWPVSLLLLLIAPVALASPGDLDPDYGKDGVVIANLGMKDGDGITGVVDAQGRALTLAVLTDNNDDWDFVVYRFLPNGDLDTSWGQGGIAHIDIDGMDLARDIALTPDGGVVVIATSGPEEARDMSIAKLTPSGTLDTAFSSDGKLKVDFGLTESGEAITVVPDGRIFVVGSTIGDDTFDRDTAVAVVDPNGQLDISFDGDGRAVLDLGGDDAGRAVTVATDGSVVIAGETDGDMVVAVLQPSGNPDPGFSGDGVATFDPGGMFDLGNAVAVDTVGRVILGGSGGETDREFVVLRYNRDGSPDPNFGNQGVQRFSFGSERSPLADLAIAPTGHIVGAGYVGQFPTRDIALARLTTSGELDEAFGQGGLITTDLGADDVASGVSVTADGSIFVFGDTTAAGSRDLLIAKYEGTPPPDDPPLVCNDSFVDDEGHVFEGDINCIAAADITRGCNPPVNDRFCPDSTVTRGQMAAFLTRALSLDPGNETFDDTNGHTFEADIAALAAADITRGCNPPANDRFCPDQRLTRGQMAAFLARALHLQPSNESFSDSDGHVFEQDIAALAAAGITKGCNPPDNTRFCPDEPVTRGQMAAFLNRALLNG